MSLRFEETSLEGVVVVTPALHEDERGTFGRTFDAELFAARGLCTSLSQASFTTNRLTGTLRGMHLQRPPWAENKLVRCTRGSVYDVVVDLREQSSTRLHWFGLVLDANDHRSLYVPAGFAHGYLTLTDDASLAYQISAPYNADSVTGFRWDDPAVGIQWPAVPTVVSHRDRTYPPLNA